MNRTKMYVALCAVVIGKKIIAAGKPIPSDVSAAKINAWLGNNSIEEVDVPEPSAEAQAAAIAKAKAQAERDELERRATELGIYQPYALNDEGLIAAIAKAEAEAKANTVATNDSVAGTQTITGDGTGQSLPDASNTEQEAEGIAGEKTAIIKRAVLPEERSVELGALSAAALKKVAGELKVAGAAQMKKEQLVEAIMAIEFAPKE
ncbi:Rho termination factor N-terminal domain-containing protein [Cellvibrio sp. PSBB023]|uniref:Rho termination factor N-terminal domain-containing protein n=1 Tax=Cellvibrio sp. PSBB023 TaxID=1945512 RepID=UPI00098FD083|nr:Rho termination factor N-terminal domain-containing protein [Cellvibrio sp. PSBB023]AQT58719.1 hypothetical protein B0D95_00385 [Cellvibrio sp. PSBB023]